MPIQTPPDGSIEECVDLIDEFVDAHARYPEPVLAFALRVHLGALLHAMLVGGQCNEQEVRDFVHELEQEALGQA